MMSVILCNEYLFVGVLEYKLMIEAEVNHGARMLFILRLSLTGLSSGIVYSYTCFSSPRNHGMMIVKRSDS